MRSAHLFVGGLLLVLGCSREQPFESGQQVMTQTESMVTTTPTGSTSPTTSDTDTSSTPPVTSEEVTADVEAVVVSGEEGSYTFAVTLRSGDEGCDAYADWWEVLSPEGELLYRRILNHSHVEEQPFTRGGGPVAIMATEVVVVRAHRHPTGYGGRAMEGRPDGTFVAIELASSFASELETTEPLPEDCWY